MKTFFLTCVSSEPNRVVVDYIISFTFFPFELSQKSLPILLMMFIMKFFDDFNFITNRSFTTLFINHISKLEFLIIFFLIYLKQRSADDTDLKIQKTLGNFDEASRFFETDAKQIIGITSYPTTPLAPTRQMPPLQFPSVTNQQSQLQQQQQIQQKQSSIAPPSSSSSTYNSNGIISNSQSINYNSSNRTTYNNNSVTSNSNSTINNVNNYQQKSTTSSSFPLAQPPQSRNSSSNSGNNCGGNSLNTSNNTSSSTNNIINNNNNNTFARPSGIKPMNGRSYPNSSASLSSSSSQQIKHEVS
jgi:hypothetical protein